MIINVKTSNSVYDVVIQKGIFLDAGKHLNLNRKVAIISDSGVPTKYIDTLKRQCKDPFVFIFNCGEENKSIDTYISIITFLINNNFTRSDVVVALGGGVVGDISGLVASTFNRGIDFYNIPTTLLSMVDSSIGGKTAIDFLNIKNIVGTFYPPCKVLIDPDTLKTLDSRLEHEGLAEAIKMATTCNEELFELIENSKNLDDDIEQIIYQSLLIKKEVVEKDEKESGLRKVLNFGHTIGHAIESIYKGKYYHGECVALGMMYMASDNVKERLKKVLKKYNLPVEINVDLNEVRDLIKHDKKATGEYIDIVKVDKIGSFTITKVSIDKVV